MLDVAAGLPFYDELALIRGVFRSGRAILSRRYGTAIVAQGPGSADEAGWVVQVRARADDPFGKVLYQEEPSGSDEARERVEALRRDLRSGKRPWDPAVIPQGTNEPPTVGRPT